MFMIYVVACGMSESPRTCKRLSVSNYRKAQRGAYCPSFFLLDSANINYPQVLYFEVSSSLNLVSDENTN